MTRSLAEAVADTARALAGVGIADSGRDARALVAAAAQVARDRLTLEAAAPLDAAAEARLGDFLAQRLQRRPVAQILGGRLFWGRMFRVTREVLDPRPETEGIVARALALPGWRRVLDLGTGSGILALTLAAERPAAQAVATDISAAALEVAGGNAAALGVAERVLFAQGDWWDGVDGRFDLVVSNPPYIPEGCIADLAPEVRDWEPQDALDGGADGLAAYRRIAAGLDRHLAPGGTALLEFGTGQEQAVSDIFASAGEFLINLHEDMDGRPRIAEVTRKG